MRSNVSFRHISMALAALFVGALYASAQETAKAQAGAADEAAIRENVRQLEAGWNTKSGALFAKPFAEDADYVVINGIQLKGREAIQQGHQRIFDTIYKDSTLGLAAKQVRYLRPDVAVAHVSARLKTGQGGEADAHDAVITLVLTRDKGEWKIAAFQNTAVVAGPRR